MKYLVVSALVVVLVVGVSTALGGRAGRSQPDPLGVRHGVIFACVETHGPAPTIGDIKLSHCHKAYKPIVWNIRGPQGEPGPAGPQGPAGPAGPAGQAAPNLTTNTLTYAPGATVTYAGVNWTGCTSVKLDTFGQGGFTVASGISPATPGGTFTGTFSAPAATGEWLLVAQGTGTNCHALAIFTVAS
jgi:hypothetical protein